MGGVDRLAGLAPWCSLPSGDCSSREREVSDQFLEREKVWVISGLKFESRSPLSASLRSKTVPYGDSSGFLEIGTDVCTGELREENIARASFRDRFDRSLSISE